jgi:hypothetical protein
VAQVAAGGGGETGGTAERRRPRSECDRHGQCCYSISADDERVPRGFLFFLNYPNRLKLANWKWMVYPAPKIHNFLHVASLRYYKQFSQFC